MVKANKIPWYQEPGTRIGYLDIESDGLKANFSTMLSWAIKEKGEDGETFYDVITKEELFDGRLDLRIIKSIIHNMKKFDIICTYYGTGFDNPYIRTKSLMWYGVEETRLLEEYKDINVPELRVMAEERGLFHRGRRQELISFLIGYELEDLVFPAFASMFHWDIYYTVRSKMNLSRKSMRVASEYLNITGKDFISAINVSTGERMDNVPVAKTPIGGGAIWSKAKYGDPDSLHYVVTHNIADVGVTEILHNKLSDYRKWIRTSI